MCCPRKETSYLWCWEVTFQPSEYCCIWAKMSLLSIICNLKLITHFLSVFILYYLVTEVFFAMVNRSLKGSFKFKMMLQITDLAIVSFNLPLCAIFWCIMCMWFIEKCEIHMWNLLKVVKGTLLNHHKVQALDISITSKLLVCFSLVSSSCLFGKFCPKQFLPCILKFLIWSKFKLTENFTKAYNNSYILLNQIHPLFTFSPFWFTGLSIYIYMCAHIILNKSVKSTIETLCMPFNSKYSVCLI